MNLILLYILKRSRGFFDSVLSVNGAGGIPLTLGPVTEIDVPAELAFQCP